MDYTKREDEDSLANSRSENYQDAQEEFEEQMSISSRFDAMEEKLRMIEDKFTWMTEDLNTNLTNEIQGIKNEISKKRIASDSFEDISTTSPHHSYLHELGRSNSRFDVTEGKLRLIEDKITRIIEDLNINLSNKITQEISVQINKKIIASNSFGDKKPSSPHHSYLHELFNSISLPGLRYVAGCEPPLHRLLWIFIHIVAFLISYAYIKDAYDDWQSSPIISSLAITKVKDIPFPSITICEFLELREDYNQSGVYETCVKEVNDTFIWMRSEEEFKMFSFSNEINPIFIPQTGGIFKQFKGIDIWSRSEYFMYLDKVVKPVDKFYEESWLPPFLSKKPAMMMDVEGRLCRCHTFNNINLRFSNLKIKDIDEDIPHNELKTSSVCTPDKIMDSDCKNNLSYIDDFTFVLPVMWSSEDMDDAYLREFGYSIFFHSPADYPQSKDYDVYRFPPNKDLSLYIAPKLINAKKYIIQLDVSERNCLFAFEKILSHFEFYTRKNCLMDCKIKCMMDKCGCVNRDFLVHNSSLPVCGWNKDFGYIVLLLDCTCNCPEDCVSLTFEVKKETTDGVRFGYKKISVRYEKPEFVSSYRYSVTSPGEFFAYALGMLGVFNGFSFMLVWEVLYWLTLRLWSTIKRYPHFQNSG